MMKNNKIPNVNILPFNGKPEDFKGTIRKAIFVQNCAYDDKTHKVRGVGRVEGTEEHI